MRFLQRQRLVASSNIQDSHSDNNLGWLHSIRQVSGLMMQETNACTPCHGTGKIFREKDRCRKCKGERVVEEKKVLEIYIPRGSKCVWLLFHFFRIY